MRPTFNVTEFQEVVHVQMNKAMSALLADLIADCEDESLEPELRALRRALADPRAAQMRRITNQSRNRSDDYKGGGYKSTGYRRHWSGTEHNEQDDRG